MKPLFLDVGQETEQDCDPWGKGNKWDEPSVMEEIFILLSLHYRTIAIFADCLGKP